MDETTVMTKQERRQARREERQAESARARRSRFVRRLILWTTVVIILAGVGWLMYRAAGTTSPTPSGVLAVPVSASDIITGPASASITLLEYADFQCPACAAYSPVVTQLLQDPQVAGKVRFVYRYFPLRDIHPNAQLSAQAAQAAALQGKFWQMHDRLFDQQDAWAGLSSDGARAKFVQYAQDLGLDMTKFNADIDSDAVKAVVNADYDSAIASGVNETPTFFVNGTVLAQPSSLDQFKQEILNPAHANQ
ncbi:MAG TPA: thioredoxin domain-containing protein [Candidatus Paceibacterota bacterium]|nr:thioredoxin domain-containing protein [Candidatus Paceibacterota bacterium]